MRKRLFIIFAVLVAVVLTLATFTRGYSFYEAHRRQQRERQAELLGQHLDAYIRAHGGRPPTDISALAAWRPLELELRRLIDSGRATYKVFMFGSAGYRYKYGVDDQGYTVEAYP